MKVRLNVEQLEDRTVPSAAGGANVVPQPGPGNSDGNLAVILPAPAVDHANSNGLGSKADSHANIPPPQTQVI